MKTIGYSHIRKWLLVYLALTLLTTMGLYLSIYLEISNALTALNLSENTDLHTAMVNTGANPIPGLKLRILIIFSGGLLLCFALGVIWVNIAARRIRRPVRAISKAMTKLARGQLNGTVVVETSDEFEQIGSSINEIATNLQELLLYIWKQTGQCLVLLDSIHNNPELRLDKRITAENIGKLDQLTASINDLREMAKAYVFYDVRIEGAKTLAISELGSGTSITPKLPRKI